MSYLTIEKEGIGKYEEKKSIFTSYAYRTEGEEEAKKIITHIKDKHKEAKHYVYSYIIGLNQEGWRGTIDRAVQIGARLLA